MADPLLPFSLPGQLSGNGSSAEEDALDRNSSPPSSDARCMRPHHPRMENEPRRDDGVPEGTTTHDDVQVFELDPEFDYGDDVEWQAWAEKLMVGLGLPVNRQAWADATREANAEKQTSGSSSSGCLDTCAAAASTGASASPYAHLSGNKGLCSWSGGKDSAVALCECVRRGLDVPLLVTMMDESGERSRSHGLREEVLREQARLMGRRLVLVRASWDNYEAALLSELTRLANDEGFCYAVFGDIGPAARDRDWEESVCKRAGLEAVLPLWGVSNAARLFLDSGIGALISVVVPELSDLLGTPLDSHAMDVVATRGFDRCGENGEYHSVVVRTPLMAPGESLRLARGQTATVAAGKLALDWTLPREAVAPEAVTSEKRECWQ